MQLGVAQQAVYWDGANEPDMAEGNVKCSPSEDTRIVVKPKDVVDELVDKETPNLDFNNAGAKIKAIEKRAKFMKDDLQITPHDEYIAIGFLKARKKYARIKHKFPWAITTEAKMGALLSKYKLQIGSMSGYHKCVPNEAVDEMEKFIKAFAKVSSAKPEFVLILDKGGKEEKLDPILLAKSPFGFYYYILGAWDKEREFIDELFINRK
jgi:hypothetical protein